MAYCHRGAESDVYVFMSESGRLECCMCSLHGEHQFTSTQAMIDHLAEHRKAGHRVPDIEDDLRRTDANNFPPQCAGGHQWGTPYEPHPDIFPGMLESKCVRCGWVNPDDPVSSMVASESRHDRPNLHLVSDDPEAATGDADSDRK